MFWNKWMYLNNGLKALFLPVLLTLTACGESVTFSPEQGEEKRYWVYAQTTRDVEREPRTLMLSQSLMHYRVDKAGDTLKLHVTPEHLQLGMGSAGFSSIESSRANDRIQQIFASGFDLSLNGKNGELIDFKAKNDDQWQTFVKQGGQVLLNGLQSTMNTPGVVQSIPAEEGSQIELPHFNGEAVTLTVQKVTEQSLFVTVASAQSKAETLEKQVYGQLEISRANGWFEKMLLVMNVPVEVYGETKMTQLALVMHPEDEPIGTFMDIMSHGYFYDDSDWFDIMPLPEDSQIQETLTLDDVLPYEHGMMTESENGFHLTSVTDLSNDAQIGRVIFRDTKAFSDENPMDVKFALPLDQQFIDEQMNMTAEAQPVGWHKQKALKEIDSISAQVDYYSVSSKRHTVQWKHNQTQTFQLGDITLTVTPVSGKQNEYLLTYFDSENSQLALAMDNVQGQMSLPKNESYPKWLTPTAKQMFSYLGNPVATEQVIALRLSSIPTAVTFQVYNLNKEANFSREMVFIDEASFLSRADMPPMEVLRGHNFLFNELEDTSASNIDTPFNFDDDLSLETESAQNAAVALPFEWENVCQFSVLDAPEINGQTLVWKPQPKTNNDVAGAPSKIEKNTTAYQLMTSDGIRLYFYDLEITTRLACKGTPSWKAVTLSPSAFPWLIDVNATESFDKNLTLKQFVSRYRIYSKTGELLRPIDRLGYFIPVDDRPISEVLFDGKYIKMSGKISRVEYYDVEGEPLEKTFVTRFPPLKKG